MYLRGCDRAAGNTAVRAAHCAARRRKDGGGGCGLSQRAWRVLVDPEGAGPEDLRITSKNYSKESTAGILIYLERRRRPSIPQASIRTFGGASIDLDLASSVLSVLLTSALRFPVFELALGSTRSSMTSLGATVAENEPEKPPSGFFAHMSKKSGEPHPDARGGHSSHMGAARGSEQQGGTGGSRQCEVTPGPMP